MKATIWLVSSGVYSDYRVDAVFTTKEKAEAYAAVLNRAYPRLYDYFVEQRTLDPETPLLKNIYEVTVDEDGEEIDRREFEALADSPLVMSSPEYDYVGYSSGIRVIGAVGVSERGFEVALKAARDELYRAKAETAEGSSIR